MKQITIHDFLTEDEIKLAVKMWNEDHSTGYAKRVCAAIISPNMERINKALGQENSEMYLAYAVEYVMMQASTDAAERQRYS